MLEQLGLSADSAVTSAVTLASVAAAVMHLGRRLDRIEIRQDKSDTTQAKHGERLAVVEDRTRVRSLDTEED
jgi:hypothetical protein